jgi:hypothetical protein
MVGTTLIRRAGGDKPFMTRDSSDFHDPKLSLAVRRAWGGECCPASVRQRVEAMFAQHDRVARPARSMWRPKLSALALAASIAIVAGVGVFALQRNQPATHTLASAASLPAELSQQLIQSHDACTKIHANDHHLFNSAPPDNFKIIAAKMTEQMKYPVIATPMGADWDFKGAAVCPVGPTKFPHLLYSHGDAFVSVFSLPASACSACPDHQTCETNVNGHPIAAFAETGGFYCVVASSSGAQPVEMQQVRAMRDQLRGQVIAMRERDSVLASR